MDSGNSGSLQSSSGGDDDFDSRGGGGGVDSSSLSALLRPTLSPSAAGPFSLHGSLYGLQDFTSAPPPQQHQQQQQAPWSSAQFMAGAASSSQRVAQADAGMGPSAHQAPDPSAAAAAAPAPPRGSRKRARASRRAPTTVLTTDTTNFRAMVQEFTGIPNPPFAAGAGVPGAAFGSRFDHIFSSSSALRSAADPASSLPPYLLRPFAQKLQTAPAPSPFAPFTSPSSSTHPSSNIGGPNANANATTANQRGGGGDDFPLPSSALLRMQQDQSSSYLSFQNLLGSTQQQQQQQHMFGGLSHGAPRLHEQSPSQLLSGGGGIGLTHGHGGMMVSEGMHMHQHQHQHQQRNDVHQGGGGDELSGVVRAGASGSSCKPNYTSHAGGASSSSAAASTDAPPDGASRPGRGEGLDPWLCTSE
uniref:Uncharacterized protein n=1 Tax=Avena sativa TaxID=4498 RepID=A0ACD5Y2K9_AVESA